jgi:hypothetical protein
MPRDPPGTPQPPGRPQRGRAARRTRRPDDRRFQQPRPRSSAGGGSGRLARRTTARLEAWPAAVAGADLYVRSPLGRVQAWPPPAGTRHCHRRCRDGDGGCCRGGRPRLRGAGITRALGCFVARSARLPAIAGREPANVTGPDARSHAAGSVGPIARRRHRAGRRCGRHPHLGPAADTESAAVAIREHLLATQRANAGAKPEFLDTNFSAIADPDAQFVAHRRFGRRRNVHRASRRHCLLVSRPPPARSGAAAVVVGFLLCGSLALTPVPGERDEPADDFWRQARRASQVLEGGVADFLVA